MPTQPGTETFPFPANEAEAKKQAAETEAQLKTSGDVPQATQRRVTVLEQFIRNRPNSRGAKFLAIMDRIRALFYDPSTPEGQQRAQQYRGRMGMVRSFLDLFGAVTGSQTSLENIGNASQQQGSAAENPPPPRPPSAF